MRPTNSSHGMAWALAMGIWQSGSPVLELATLVGGLHSRTKSKARAPHRSGVATHMSLAFVPGVARGKGAQYFDLTLYGGPGKCLRLAREECVPCLGKTAISTTCPAFEISSKRRKSFPSEARVKRGDRVVHGDVELIERLGRNDLCPCGSGRRFQTLLSQGWPL
jgi:SEC-C motif